VKNDRQIGLIYMNDNQKTNEEEKAIPVQVVMSDLATLTKALDEIGIEYTVRELNEYKYLFLGERRDLNSICEGKFNDFNEGDIDILTRRHKFFEFENDNLVSYPNS
jgi:hypothetical protein